MLWLRKALNMFSKAALKWADSNICLGPHCSTAMKPTETESASRRCGGEDKSLLYQPAARLIEPWTLLNLFLPCKVCFDGTASLLWLLKMKTLFIFHCKTWRTCSFSPNRCCFCIKISWVRNVPVNIYGAHLRYKGTPCELLGFIEVVGLSGIQMRHRFIIKKVLLM